jgi:hypothetical protein
MNNLLYLAAVVLVIVWLIGYLGLGQESGIIHILLVLAVVAVLLRLIGRGGSL